MSGPCARIEIEPIAILKDVCGLDSVQTLEVLEWVGKSLIVASKTSSSGPGTPQTLRSKR